MKVDFHVHSTASDGTLTPSQVVDFAVSRDVTVISLTDHDNLSGFHFALEHASASGVVVVSGVELSVDLPDGTGAHLLGYHIDPHDTALVRRLDELRIVREQRILRMIEALEEGGFPVDIEQVRSLAMGTLGRCHLARALVAHGHATDISDAFSRFIGVSRPFHVPKPSFPVEEAIALIKGAGGVPVVAHPILDDVIAHVEELIEYGIEGVEAYHIDQTPEQQHALDAFAEERGLLVTGGSDFHAVELHGHTLGAVDIPVRHIHAFLERGGIPVP